MTDFRALCAELVDALDSGIPTRRICMSPLANRARAALAEQPVGPTDEELNHVYQQAYEPAWERSEYFGYHLDGLRAVLARWGSPTGAPVPLSVRLPRPEDYDAEGRCWWGRSGPDDWCPDWTLTTHEAMLMFCDYNQMEVWLPAHALPVLGDNA